MNRNICFEELRNHYIVQRTIKSLFDARELEIVERPASYIIKQVNEIGDRVFRLIVLPPLGYTTNSINMANSHPEARWAKINIKGGVREGKAGYSQIKNAIKFIYYTKRQIQTVSNEPNVEINASNLFYREIIKSSKETFFVVRENGEGFFHNLINLSNDWIVLVLEKFLSQRREIDFGSAISALSLKQRIVFQSFFQSINELGDEIFKKEPELINQITSIEVDIILPLLIECLNISETGKHEPCSIFAVLLKVARGEPQTTLNYLQIARLNKYAPIYYLDQLILKINKFSYIHVNNYKNRNQNHSYNECSVN